LTESARTSEKTYRDGLADVAGLVFQSLHYHFESIQTAIDILEADGNTTESSVASLKSIKAALIHLHDNIEDEYFLLLDNLKKQEMLADLEKEAD
jgi:hypothetical protein